MRCTCDLGSRATGDSREGVEKERRTERDAETREGIESRVLAFTYLDVR
jgi:hypothetical protein